jgi:NADPH:quinone reductase-like Zn-dependent oxidoreductase
MTTVRALGDLMKAVRYHAYGSPDVLRLQDVDMPVIGSDDLLVRVRAASVNPLDWHFMRGMPYLARLQAGLVRPKASARLGADMAGSVEAVGSNVARFAPGDEVFGGLPELGTLAEYIRIRQDAVVLPKPAGLTFEEAAAVPVAGFTALQALRDKGKLQAGQRVLINGAAGGVGTFAVQIAKALGAEVTGVCSTAKVELVGSIGADRVIDYTKDDYTRSGQRYDLLVDIAGNRTLAECRRVLTPRGVLVGVGAPEKGRWIGPAGRGLKIVLLSPVVSQRLTIFLAQQRRDDLAVLRDLIDTGKVTPVIDKTYPLTAVAEAIAHLETGHARGKIVVSV